MIRTVGKKLKVNKEPIADREITTEADYFARKCGLTREEARRILNEASETSGPQPPDHKKGLPPESFWSRTGF